MSAVAGSVPTQGFSVSEATTAKKRGERGILGDGTPGSRLKAMWHADQIGKKKGQSLRTWVRYVANPNHASPEINELAKKWLDSKKPHGGPATLAARKARRERISSMYALRPAKGAKTNIKVKKDGR